MHTLEKTYQIDSQYEIKHYIESTSFCELYSAIDIKTKKPVNIGVYNAAKISRNDLDSDGNLREVGFLKKSIKGFPKYLDDGEFIKGVDKFRFIVTEHIMGESVEDRMKRKGSYDEFDAKFIIYQILDIANELHAFEEPILFNGLSLDNLMIDMSRPSEQIVIRNIINVRFFKDQYKYKYINGVNPNYLAPEVFTNVFNPKTDIYNIGAIFYHLLCSTPPWYVELNPKDYFSNSSIDKIDESRESILDFPVNHNTNLKVIIKKSLSLDVDERFTSVDDFIEALKEENAPQQDSGIEKKRGHTRKKRKRKSFKDVAGMEDLKNILRKDVIGVIENAERYKKFGAKMMNGLLLYGPPGCGKTHIAECLAGEIDFYFMQKKSSDINSKFINQTGENIANIFNEATSNSPTILFLDEIDAIAPKRGATNQHQMIASGVNELLTHMNNAGEDGVFVVAATNYLEKIDDAIRRTGRIDKIVYVAPPDFEARKGMFELMLKDKPCDFGIDYNELSKITENYASSDIKSIIDIIARDAAYNNLERISMDLILVTIKDNPSRLSKNIIDKYLDAFASYTSS